MVTFAAVLDLYLSFDDITVGKMLFSVLLLLHVLFSNWGTPPLNTFDNEMDVFQYFMSNSHTVAPFNYRPESRDYESTRVSI